MPPLPCRPVLAPKARIPTENRVDVRKGIRTENFAPIINQMDPNSHTPYRLGRRPGQQGPRNQLRDQGLGDKCGGRGSEWLTPRRRGINSSLKEKKKKKEQIELFL